MSAEMSLHWSEKILTKEEIMEKAGITSEQYEAAKKKDVSRYAAGYGLHESESYRHQYIEFGCRDGYLYNDEGHRFIFEPSPAELEAADETFRIRVCDSSREDWPLRVLGIRKPCDELTTADHIDWMEGEMTALQLHCLAASSKMAKGMDKAAACKSEGITEQEYDDNIDAAMKA